MTKKLLFTLFIIACFMSSSQAQVIFSQDFQSNGNNIPVGWKQQNPSEDPSNLGWQFGTYAGGYFGGYDVPYHGNMAYVNDDDNNHPTRQNYDTLYSPIINLNSYSKIFISFDVWYYQYYIGTATLAASIDGGHTWATLDTNGGSSGFNWRTAIYDISSLGGQANVMLAFTYSDGGYTLLGECINYVTIYSPDSLDLSITRQNLTFLCGKGNPYQVSGTLRNFGSNTIHSMRLNYSVNGGPVASYPITGLNISELTNYSFIHPISWIPSITGNNVMKIWADSINGNNADQNHANDTLTTTFLVIDSIQVKEPLIEEFSQASCGPCLYYAPRFDSIADSVKTFCNTIHYHVNWPARDFINNVTEDAIYPRVNLYVVPGVPDVFVDGAGSSSPTYKGLLQEKAIGSQFKITINATYSPGTRTYNVSTGIKSFAQLPSGLKAYVVLTVDTIKYQNDQSLEDPQAGFEPPIGVTNGGDPDNIYSYTLDFPEVVEAIMPDGYGTKLGSFTPGQTETLNYSWIKDHAWADSNKLWKYDSVGTHITVFIQDSVSKYVYQSAIAVPTITTGMPEFSNNNDFELFPNPANLQTTLAFNLNEEQEVSMEILNLLGEKVYSNRLGKLSPGTYSENIATKTMCAGVYLVRLITDKGTTVKRLVVQ